MRIVVIIMTISILGACSIEKHLSIAQKHIDIAKRKGAIINPDTTWQYKYEIDTVWNYSNNTFETKHILKDSFPYAVTTTISAGMTRQERLALEDMFRHMEKMMKLENRKLKMELKAEVKENKQDNKTARVVSRQENKRDWLWIILPWAIIVGYIVIKYGLKYIKLWIK
jgi:Ser-tRNA(Ala) deacylase AlaX